MSLNKYLVERLQAIAEQATNPGPNHDLDFAIGSMTDGHLVDKALSAFSVVDDAWR